MVDSNVSDVSENDLDVWPVGGIHVCTPMRIGNGRRAYGLILSDIGKVCCSLMFVRTLIVSACLCAMLAMAACGGADSDNARDATQTSEAAANVDARMLQPLVAGREFTAPDGRYSVRVPADWIKEERALADLAFHSSAPGSDVRFNITSETNPSSRTLQGYAQTARQTVEETFTNVLSVSFTPVQVGGREAMRWMYTAQVNNASRLYYQLYVVESDRAYVLTGIAPAEASFDEIRVTFDAVAGSFKLGRG